ncbi:hypothetical protein BDF14DRAFT_1817701 [Spinellus fusiger]|nr:hypothetical protein BDF14DRAFT_1817701 [Spinellus fusiger]
MHTLPLPPLRSLVLQHHTQDTLSITPPTPPTPPTPHTLPHRQPLLTSQQEILSLIVACHYNLSPTDRTTVCQSIAIMKRHLKFSCVTFAQQWCQQKSTVSCLTAYHQLWEGTGGGVSLDVLLHQASPVWLVEQLKQLVLEDPTAYQDFMARLVAVEEKGAAVNSTLLLLLSSALDRLMDINESMIDSIYLVYLLELLQEKQKLLWMRWEERLGVVEAILDKVLWTHRDISKDTSHPMTKEQCLVDAKIFICTDTSDAFHSRIPVLSLVLQWFTESEMPLSQQCQSIPVYFLHHCTTHRITLSNSALLFGLCRIACSEWQTAHVAKCVACLHATTDLLVEQLAGHDATKVIFLLGYLQILLHFTGSQIHLHYSAWFHSTWVDKHTTRIHSKKEGQMLLQCLEAMAPYELPAILQIHVRLMQHCHTLPASSYVAMVKARLVSLDMEPCPKQIPLSILAPLLADVTHIRQGHTQQGIHTLMVAYAKTSTIPKSLLEDSIFHARWFKTTFVPALLQWKPHDGAPFLIKAHQRFLHALCQMGKISTPLLPFT